MSRRDRLRAKTRRRTHYDLVLTEPEAAQTAVNEAKAELQLAKLRYDADAEHPEVIAAAEALQRAVERLREHVERIEFEGISEREFEELRSQPEHAPTPEQMRLHAQDAAAAKKAGRSAPSEPDFNPDTLMPALFARCVVTPEGELPLTEAEWAAELAPGGRWLTQERSDAFGQCVAAILQPRSVQIPKG